MKKYKKRHFPLDKIRRFLEPGPIVLISSAYKEERNIMTLGWHMMLGFKPALIGCYIWDRNRSHSLIRKSRECVINLPTSDLIEEVIGIGNCHGPKINKFEEFGLTAESGKYTEAPLISECYANFECKLKDASQVDRIGLFIFECVRARVATSPHYPTTVHYRGDGVFMISGRNRSYKKKFKPENL